MNLISKKLMKKKINANFAVQKMNLINNFPKNESYFFMSFYKIS